MPLLPTKSFGFRLKPSSKFYLQNSYFTYGVYISRKTWKLCYILLTFLTLFSSNPLLYSFSGSVTFDVVDILIFMEDTSGRTAFSNSNLYNVLSTLSKVGTPSFFAAFVLGAFILPDSFYVSF